jgi:hypothetical protein
VGIDGPRAGPQHDQLKRRQAAMENNGDGEEEGAAAKLFHPDALSLPSCCCGCDVCGSWDARDRRKLKLGPAMMGDQDLKKGGGKRPSIMPLIRRPYWWRRPGQRCGCSGICTAADGVGSCRA